MGNDMSRGWRLWGLRKHRYVALLGIDSAGKTTVRNWLTKTDKNGKQGKGNSTRNMGETVPTLESSFSPVSHKSFKLMLWDMGGQTNLRPFWRHHLTGLHGVVFVVDSADLDRMAEVRTELQALFEDPQLQDTAFLILANKQDQSTAQTPDAISQALQLDIIDAGENKHKRHVQGCVATGGEGLFEGMDWLCSSMPTF